MGDAAHWDHYWRLGHQHSCFSGGQAVEAGELWGPFFQRAPVGARVLDLACGAGAVARHAVNASRGLDVTGVDFATHIRPVDGVRFVTGASIEALPFADAAFDIVVSQFGFEYANEERALREAARVLAPGGSLQFLIHAREGAAVRDLAGRLERAQALLAEGGFVVLLKQWAEAASFGRQAAELEARALAARAVAGGDPGDDTTRRVIGALDEAFAVRRFAGPGHVLEKANALIEELTQYCDRVGDMQAAARSESDVRSLAVGLQAQGLVCAPSATAFSGPDGAILGWVVAGARPS